MQDSNYPDFGEVSLEELERIVSVVSLETIASSQFLMDTRARFTQFFGKADTFFKQLKFPNVNAPKLNGFSLMKSVNKVGFVDSTVKTVTVPVGFTGQWVPYATDLYTAIKASGQLVRIVEDYNRCLGQLVSNPDMLKAATGIPFNAVYDVGLYNLVQKMLKDHFDSRSEVVTRELGSVLERVADIPLVMNTINDATAFDKANPSTNITKAIGRSMALSKQLLPMMDDTDAKVSKPVREQLIALTYSLAREIEAYSVVLYRLRQFALSVEESVNALDKA